MHSLPDVKTRVLILACALFALPALAAEDSTQAAITKELRKECHAYFYYTAALAETSHKPRMELLNRAIELNPRLARAFYNRGYLYFGDGDLPRARADFKQAVEIDGSFISAHYNLACVYSMESQPAESLASLEKALASGYSKFDKIPNDSDLKNLKGNAALAPLIAKYQARSATTKPNVLQRYQTSDVDLRLNLLDDEIRAPTQRAEALASWAMHDGEYETRVLAMELWRKIDAPQSKPALLRGLYDNNGYVNKAAGNALVSYGKDIGPLMIATLDDKGTGVPFYALQVLSLSGAPKTEASIAPLLRDDDARLRQMAAESLAHLGAFSYLPQVQAALTNLPEKKQDQDYYTATLNRAILELKRAKDNSEERQRTH